MITTLLIIDPQNDFCDPKGALCVPGASEDLLRISSMINRIDQQINSIHITMDTHHLYHIAHPLFWLNNKNEHPDPFTIISLKDVASGTYKASAHQFQLYAENYLASLEKTDKYNLCIWPPHCLIGSWGHNIYDPLAQTLLQWEEKVPGRVVEYTYKGSNVKTEHYSAIRAEVADTADPNSLTNFALIEKLKVSDNIIIAGEALSHCVANTVRDLLTSIPSNKIIILTDASSNVTGFEQFGEDFLEEMKLTDVRFLKTTEVLA